MHYVHAGIGDILHLQGLWARNNLIRDKLDLVLNTRIKAFLAHHGTCHDVTGISTDIINLIPVHLLNNKLTANSDVLEARRARRSEMRYILAMRAIATRVHFHATFRVNHQQSRITIKLVRDPKRPCRR